ncbi:MAG: DUF167 domain-containing protein [Kiritimatiellae bacterium]|nr:DUF167 domain-containing protein [Kiritimatiellia bacterium]
MHDSSPEPVPLPAWISAITDGCRLTVRVSPGASRSEIAGTEEGWLKIRLTAPPVDNKANKELIRFLSKTLKTSQRSITICSGATSRLKGIKISGVRPKDFLHTINLKP